MNNNFVNINDKELVLLTRKLEQLHKSAMPVAIRGTLNDLAFDMRITSQKTFQHNFTIRKKSFLRSHSTVIKSPNTFDLKQMQSSFGIIKGKSQSGDDLQTQEFGGIVKNRDYIPFKTARTAKSENKLVSKRYYIKKIKPRKNKSIYRNQELIKTAFKVGKGGFILYDDILFEVRTIKSRPKFKINLKPLYSYKNARKVKIKKDPFLLPAQNITMKKVANFYTIQANRRFQKYLKK